MNFDLIVIGAGPGGYVAAIRASQLGMKVAVIDKRERLGGTCLNVGCIPSKAFLDATEKLTWIQEKGPQIGVGDVKIPFNFEKLLKEKEKIIESLTKGIAYQFEKNKITFFKGEGAFLNENEIEISDAGNKEKLSAKFFLIATGSTPIEIPFLAFDEKTILSSTGGLDLQKVPSSLLVVGGGVIGVELASVYQRLGTQVSIVEMLEKIIPSFDETLSKSLLISLKKQGLQFHLREKLLSAEIGKDQVILKSDKQTHVAEKVLVAVGRKPYTEGLSLEKIDLSKNQQGQIVVDSSFRTNKSHIFAIGDVIDGPMLAHKASEEGITAVEIMAGNKAELDYLTIPNVVYTHPEVASVGLTEEEAKNLNLSFKIGISYLKGNPRAKTALEKEGFVKVIGEKKTGKLLGMHLFMPHASEMIALGSLAIKKRLTFEEIAKLPFSHPTLSEAIKEAFLEALEPIVK